MGALEEAYEKAQEKPHVPLQERSLKAVYQPNHYTYGKVELIELIRDLPFWQGNAIKYIYRAGKKDNLKQDLLKAKWYIDSKLKELEDE